MQQLALALVSGRNWLRSENECKSVEDVFPSFPSGAALAEYARNRRNRGDDPAVVSVLLNDRQIHRFAHIASVAPA